MNKPQETLKEFVFQQEETDNKQEKKKKKVISNNAEYREEFLKKSVYREWWVQ